jgi:hypothetical protein
MEERKLWHSHVHEVKSGALTAPGIPDIAEHELMEKFVGTYGKTIHTWQTDRGDTLPIGIPQIMMAFTKDGQVNPDHVRARDLRMRSDTEAIRRKRADIPTPEILPGADAWQKGETIQLRAAKVE